MMDTENDADAQGDVDEDDEQMPDSATGETEITDDSNSKEKRPKKPRYDAVSSCLVWCG